MSSIARETHKQLVVIKKQVQGSAAVDKLHEEKEEEEFSYRRM
jgi:hypothetical protein